MGEWSRGTVLELQAAGVLLVEDGNHGECRPRPDEFVSRGVAFIRAADMDNGRVLFDAASKINEVARRRITKGVGARGDVLLSHKGTVGKVALVPDDAPDFVCSPQTTFWRVLDEDVLDRRYLHAFLRSPDFHRQLATRAGETDMAPYVSLTSQRGLTVSFPPLSKQRAIARILGALDDKIELNRKMNATLEAMARALFKSWFVDFDPVRAKAEGRAPSGMDAETAKLFPSEFVESELGMIPKGWEPGRIGDVIEIHDSRRVPLSSREREQRRGPFPYYGATSVMDYVDSYLFDGRFVLVGEDGSVVTPEGLPFTQYVWGRFWVNNHAHVLTGIRGFSQEHLYLLFQQTNIAAYVTGAVQAKLSQGNMRKIPVVVAPDAVNAKFGSVLDPLFARFRALTEESRTLARIRDELLPRLLSGELPVDAAERAVEEVA